MCEARKEGFIHTAEEALVSGEVGRELGQPVTGRVVVVVVEVRGLVVAVSAALSIPLTGTIKVTRRSPSAVKPISDPRDVWMIAIMPRY